MAWTELEVLLVGEYADEGTAVESLRILIKLGQMKGESSEELGVRTEKLAALAFHEKVNENVAMQTQLPDQCMWKHLKTTRIRHDIIKEAPVKLTLAIAIAKDGDRILVSQDRWEKNPLHVE